MSNENKSIIKTILNEIQCSSEVYSTKKTSETAEYNRILNLLNNFYKPEKIPLVVILATYNVLADEKIISMKNFLVLTDEVLAYISENYPELNYHI